MIKFKGTLKEFKEMMKDEVKFIEGVGIVGDVINWQDAKKAVEEHEDDYKKVLSEDVGEMKDEMIEDEVNEILMNK